MNDIKALCDQVRQTSDAIHIYHGHGNLEKVDAIQRGMGGFTALFSALFAFFAVK